MKKIKKYMVIILLLIILFVCIWYKKELKDFFQEDLIFFKLFEEGNSTISLNKISDTKNSEEKDILFDVTYKNLNFKDINLLETIDEKTLVNNKIAPGTKGEFTIIIVSNIEQKYKIEFESKNTKPENLYFYLEEGEKYKTLEELAKFLEGKIEANTKVEYKVFWEWQYEQKKNKAINDNQDTKDGTYLNEYNFVISTCTIN